MINKVIKRDGRIVDFNKAKIVGAIMKAMYSQNVANLDEAVKLGEQVFNHLKEKFHVNSIPAVEEIQDLIETILMDNRHVGVAKAYILYREQHKKLRDIKNTLSNIKKIMDGYLKQDDWRVNENSNVDYCLGGLILHNSGAITANYWLDHIYTEDIANAHKDGDFHIHDLNMFSGYCAGWSLRQLIKEGLGGIKGKISSKPANHLTTLINQIVNFLGILQNEWAGAQAFSSFDTYLAPFVRRDNLTYEEVKQCIQSFIFGINTPSRWGGQAPFTNITLDWNIPEDLKDKKAIVGGKEIEFKYGDCQREMDMINKALLEVLWEGDAEGRGFFYPIPTYNITKDFDWEHPNCELLFKITGKYGTPYFQNFINSDLNPEDVRSMCCRLQLDKTALRKRGGGLFGSDEFTGSIGVVTINLSRIGYLSKDEKEFFERLSRMMFLAKESLEIKRGVIVKLLEQGLYPYTKRFLKHWNNHFSTIGIIGMNEACLNFFGKTIDNEECKNFTIKVLEYMRNKLIKYQEDTGNLYNLEATPGEGTSYRLAKKDKEKYTNIITAGEKEPYYTNSTQLPVNYTEDIFEALELQEDIQKMYTGGTVFHAFVGEEISDFHICKEFVKTIVSNFHIPYLTISPTYSICLDHGYISGEHFSCPNCNKECEVYSRIVGYYRPVQNWNKGKKEEFNIRKTFKVEKKQKKDELLYKVFTLPNCEKCTSLKDFLETFPVKGDIKDLSNINDLKEFQKYYSKVRDKFQRDEQGRFPVPAVLFFDSFDNIVATANSIEQVKDFLAK